MPPSPTTQLAMIGESESVLDLSSSTPSPFLLAVVALTLGILANVWIQTMLSGDQGLGSFLSDGSGFNKSKFRPMSTDDYGQKQPPSNDPLPWLRLPNLDFVDVAGAPKTDPATDPVLDRLQRLRLEMQDRLAAGDRAGAESIRATMEQVMKENGVSFIATPSQDVVDDEKLP